MHGEQETQGTKTQTDFGRRRLEQTKRVRRF
jgi:hypothetical protein